MQIQQLYHDMSSYVDTMLGFVECTAAGSNQHSRESVGVSTCAVPPGSVAETFPGLDMIPSLCPLALSLCRSLYTRGPVDSLSLSLSLS